MVGEHDIVVATLLPVFLPAFHSLVPRPHPQKEGKGSGDFWQFSWFGRLWARVPTQVHMNKARI